MYSFRRTSALGIAFALTALLALPACDKVKETPTPTPTPTPVLPPEQTPNPSSPPSPPPTPTPEDKEEAKAQARATFSADNDRYSTVILSFTGERCVFCPNMAQKLRPLEAKHDPNVILVAMHCWRNYSANYHDSDAQQYANALRVEGIPSAHVDNLRDIEGYTSWSALIQDRLALPDIYKTYIQPSWQGNKLRIQYLAEVRPEYIAQATKQLKLLYWITESELRSPQSGSSDPQYHHKGVMRGALRTTRPGYVNSAYYGEAYTAGSLVSSDFVLPSLIRNTANCQLVAILVDVSASEGPVFIDAIRVPLPAR